MEAVTLKEAKKMQATVNSAILRAVHDFEEATGLCVESIRLDHTFEFGKAPRVVNVGTNVAL